MRVIALLALCFAAVAAVPKNPQRIVGGSVTTIDQYPSMASLLFSWGASGPSQACGGTILNNRSILTAAHCTIGDAAAKWQVRVGSTNANSGGTVYRTQSIINHPNYSAFTTNNDIGLIRILGTFTYSNTVLPASIAGNNYNLNDDEVVWAAGWGAVSPGGESSEQLRHVQIWTINHQTCATRYLSLGRLVTENMLCSGWLDVGGRDQCLGDSGGPLFHNGIVVGVCSWGYSCALPRYPGVNARVSRFTNWIVSNV